MVAKTSVLYPKDVAFDLDYYLKVHMEMVKRVWTKYGLKDYQVVQYSSHDAPYRIQATFTWDSIEGSATAMTAEDSKPIFDDIPNFSNKSPVLTSGNVVGSWQLASESDTV